MRENTFLVCCFNRFLRNLVPRPSLLFLFQRGPGNEVDYYVLLIQLFFIEMLSFLSVNGLITVKF